MTCYLSKIHDEGPEISHVARWQEDVTHYVVVRVGEICHVLYPAILLPAQTVNQLLRTHDLNLGHLNVGLQVLGGKRWILRI